MPDGLVEPIPHVADAPHPMGRSVVNHDPRNREWPARALLAAARARKPGPWWARHNFDQRGSSCTTQAATGLLLSSPVRKTSRNFLARVVAELGTEDQRHAFYELSKRYDPWPAENYEGTSTDAPYKLMRERGLIREWRWCFGFRDVVDVVQAVAAVTCGTVWLESMFTVDRRGYVVVDRASPVAGGHEWLLLDFDDGPDDEGLALNSWGRSWGKAGRFRIKGDDLRWLLEQNGDAATVVAAA